MLMDELAQVFSAPLLNQNQHDLGEEDFSDATLRLINQMLMEEDDLENKPCMFQESLALQATEKSFYDALGKDYTPPSNQSPLAVEFDRTISSPNGDYSPYSNKESFDSLGSVNNFVDLSNWLLDREKHDQDFYSEGSVESHFSPSKVSESSNGSVGEEDENKREKSPNTSSRKKKSRDQEDRGDIFADGGRGNKQLASSAQESHDHCEIYDKVLLCPPLNPNSHQDSSLFLVHDRNDQNEPLSNGSNSNVGGRGHIENQGNDKEVVDLMTLLSQCAQAVSRADQKNAYYLLNQIKQHSSPYGNEIKRLAHYFGNALEARLAGTGAALYAALATKRISTADILRGYGVQVKACPFNWLSNGYANRSIRTLVQDSQRLHIIDFGILYGFQWPCLIQNLSMRPGGPPRLKITGIDFPQPGFRPSERVEETGRRLATYCQRFNVPFQFNAVAKKWDSINLDELKIEGDEVVVVNCLYRLRNVPDETATEKCPRDIVLNLVRKINPNMFIFGVLNGACNAPFFMSRFREAVFCASALFDMFESTVPREDEGRRLYEKEVWGRDIMNVIACEGSERVERPETYKQWQNRNVRAGFRQLPLDREILRELKSIVKVRYNKNFTVEDDGKWMLQGWKGRIMFAFSCWKPIKES